MRLLNPGSPTDRRRQPFATFMTASVEDGVLGEVQLHRLGPASSSGRGPDVPGAP